MSEQTNFDWDKSTGPYVREKNALTPNTFATSKAAASDLPNAGTQRRRVYDFIASQPNGVTDQEMQLALNLPPNVLTPRRGELVKANLVLDSGATRETLSGKQAVVWIAAKQKTGE